MPFDPRRSGIVEINQQQILFERLGLCDEPALGVHYATATVEQELVVAADLVAEQDRTVLRADVNGYLDTLEPGYARRVGAEVKEALQAPYTAYRQEMVRLSVNDDGLHAQGIVLVHSQLAEGVPTDQGTLYALTFVTRNGRWLVGGREPLRPVLSLPPPRAN